MTQHKPNAEAAAIEQRLADLFNEATTDVLIESLLTIVEQQQTDQSPLLARQRLWLIDELEERYPEVREAIDQAFADALDEETRTEGHVIVNYVDVLITAVRAAQAAESTKS